MTLAPDQLPNDVAALQAIIARQAAELEDAKNQLKARDVVIEQLQLNLDKLKRSQFGRSSEKVQRQIDQLELTLEDLQTDRAAEQAEENDEAGDQAKDDDKQGKKKRGRKKLPAHLPRERSVLDPGDICPDCGGELRLLGEDKPAPPERNRLPEQHWTPTRLAINLMLQKPALALTTGTHHELADSGIPGIDLLLKLLDRIHDEPEITTQNLLDRFQGDANETHLYKLAAMEPPIEDEDSLERMFADCLQSLQKQYIDHRQKALITKLQSGQGLTEAEKIEHKKLFTNQPGKST